MQKKHRNIIVGGVLWFTIGMIGLFVKEDISHYFNIHPFISFILPICALLIGLTAILYVYLQGWFNKEMGETNQMTHQLSNEFEKFKKELTQRIDEKSNANFSAENIQEIVE